MTIFVLYNSLLTDKKSGLIIGINNLDNLIFFLDINNERVGIGSKNNIRTDLSAEYAAVEDEAKTPETYLAAQEEGSYIIKTETEIIQSDNNKIEDSIFV